MNDFSTFIKLNVSLVNLLKAAVTTLELALFSLLIGLALALLFAMWESIKFKPIAYIGTAFIALLRGLPEILIVMFVYFGLLISFAILADGITLNLILVKIPLQMEINTDPFICGVIALSLLYAAYASQTIRGAIKAIPLGQWEAGQALGLTRKAIFFRLIMPQMWRHALPGLGNQWLVLLKDTALISLISVNDLMLQADSIIHITHAPFTWYMITALIYLFISMISQFILNKIESRTTRYIRGTS